MADKGKRVPAKAPAPKAPAEDAWVLPALRGVQAQHLYYVAMLRLRDLEWFFARIDPKDPADLRAQRALSRVPTIARYIVGNPKTYVFGALVGAIDVVHDPMFEPSAPSSPVGLLRLPRSSHVALLDGQHRKAGIAAALADDRTGTLRDESIAVVLFFDKDLETSQQKFADLNRHAVRPSGSIGLLYDHRDEAAALSRAVVNGVPIFKKLTDAEHASAGGNKLFALASLHAATKALVSATSLKPAETKKLAVDFWGTVAAAMPDWLSCASGSVTAGDLRDRYVHAHGVALQALGRTGSALLREHPETWKEDLARLGTLDWTRAAPRWANRSVVQGRISKSATAVALTANAIKAFLNIELGADDRRHELLAQGGAQ